MCVEAVRVFVVIALLGAAAALATPKGRLPLALRGVYRILKRDRGETVVGNSSAAPRVSLVRRLLAFVLVILSILTALIQF